jgi:hypothetical protein
LEIKGLVVVVELSSYSLFSMLVNICIKICLHVDICIVITDCLSVFSGKQVPYPRVSTHELLLSALLNIGKARRTSAWYGQPFFRQNHIAWVVLQDVLFEEALHDPFDFT